MMETEAVRWCSVALTYCSSYKSLGNDKGLRNDGTIYFIQIQDSGATCCQEFIPEFDEDVTPL